MALALDAPAKVNLHLAVLGRRPDGYHELDTVMHALALHDTLTVEVVPADGLPAIDLTITSEVESGLPVPAGPDNLVGRAARAFFAAPPLVAAGADCRRIAAIRCHLHKRIPAGGGLGGGSSDVAAMLRLLNELYDRPLTTGDLHALAAPLSADAPFFLAGGTQRATGIGDRLRPVIAVPHRYFVLILPPVGAATAAVYQNLAAPLTTIGSGASIRVEQEPLNYQELALSLGFRNDLEASALELYPVLADLRGTVSDAGYPQVQMSGSGSTFFLALKDVGECVDAMDTLAPLRQQGVGLVMTESNVAQQGVTRSVRYPDRPSNAEGAR